MDFWLQVRKAGYKEDDILEEVDQLMNGGAWVDWDDKRNTDCAKKITFPKKPWLCRLSGPTWSKCQKLFEKIDKDHTQVLTPDNVHEFFKGTFAAVSADAMFNEIDVQRHGTITAVESM